MASEAGTVVGSDGAPRASNHVRIGSPGEPSSMLDGDTEGPLRSRLERGEIVADRFEIEARLGVGGTGAVYRALDRASGAAVAIKVLHWGSLARGRLAREAEVLADLSHPGIVRYVAHGTTARGAPFLAMELVLGETLAERLAGRRLAMDRALVLARRVAEALAFAHERGVIHRDIKPDNILLEGGSIERPKILDFGLASLAYDPERLTQPSSDRLTQPGLVVGTPEYMAPEQVRGSRSIDARADVFALGCVLFECLAGTVPFHAADPLAVLSKIVLDEPQPLCTLAPDVPRALELFVGRMLAKDPDRRPATAAEVAAELAAVADEQAAIEAPSRRGPALGGDELVLLSVIVAIDAAAPPAPDEADDGPPVPRETSDAELDRLREVARPHGAAVDRLVDGTIIATLSGRGAATDLAVHAARCALAMRRVLVDAPLALATGSGSLAGRLAMGEAIERAVLLARADHAARLERRARPLPVRIDAVTRGLLDPRFKVETEGAALLLRREREAADAARTLLGRPAPFVGRDTELGALRELFEQRAAEGSAASAIVVGPAGAGKSRLAGELARVLKRSQGAAARAEVWTVRGESLRSGSPFGLLAQTLRRAPPETQRALDFSGALAGAARKDALLRGDAMRRDWEDWLRAECDARPILLVVEDLQWADRPSVDALGTALRRVRDRPLFLLALARPEVDAVFPGVWADRGATTVTLGPLAPEAIERIAREALGREPDAATLAWLVRHAQGSPLYLEELLYVVAQGRAGELPGTLRAMTRARLDALPAGARRVLRAASVFGEVLTASGVAALLGGAPRGVVLAELDGLVERELLSTREPGRAAGGLASWAAEEPRGLAVGDADREYVFRHSLVREAAYETLTPPDRALGHELAATWLEAVGVTEPLLLATHLERAGQPRRAADGYARAAELALDANDFGGAIARAERAADCGVAVETLGPLRLLQVEAHRWRGEIAEARRRAGQAAQALPRGGSPWLRAITDEAVASSRLGDAHDVAGAADAIERALESTGSGSISAGVWGPSPDGEGDASRRAPEPDRDAVAAAARMTMHLASLGWAERAERLAERLEAAAGPLATSDPSVAARLEHVRSWRAGQRGDTGAQLRHLEAAIERFEQAGDARNGCKERVCLGRALNELGLAAKAEAALRDARTTADALGIDAVARSAQQGLAIALVRQGRLPEARREAEEVLAFSRARQDRRLEATCATTLAAILRLEGDADGAERAALAAVEAAAVPLDRSLALAALAEARLARKRPAEALEAASEAAELLQGLSGVDHAEGVVRLAHAAALHAAGRTDLAREVIGAARGRVRARAAVITNRAHRESFLEKVPENARTMALARSWLEGARG